MIRRTVRTARAIRAVVAHPPYATPGHFYSPITTNDDVSRPLRWTGVLAQLRPSRLIEVGSGYSTALALDEDDQAVAPDTHHRIGRRLQQPEKPPVGRVFRFHFPPRPTDN